MQTNKTVFIQWVNQSNKATEGTRQTTSSVELIHNSQLTKNTTLVLPYFL